MLEIMQENAFVLETLLTQLRPIVLSGAPVEISEETRRVQEAIHALLSNGENAADVAAMKALAAHTLELKAAVGLVRRELNHLHNNHRVYAANPLFVPEGKETISLTLKSSLLAEEQTHFLHAADASAGKTLQRAYQAHEKFERDVLERGIAAIMENVRTAPEKEKPLELNRFFNVDPVYDTNVLHAVRQQTGDPNFADYERSHKHLLVDPLDIRGVTDYSVRSTSKDIIDLVDAYINASYPGRFSAGEMRVALAMRDIEMTHKQLENQPQRFEQVATKAEEYLQRMSGGGDDAEAVLKEMENDETFSALTTPLRQMKRDTSGRSALPKR